MRRHLDSIIKISFVVYLAILFILLFVRTRGGWWDNLSIFEYARMHMNLIPLQTILGYLTAIKDQTMNLNIPIENLSGNLLMFLPAGIYLPWFSKRIDSLKSLLLNILPIFFIIELAQFFTKRGAFDIDDLILNLLGVIIGYWIWRSPIIQNIINRFR